MVNVNGYRDWATGDFPTGDEFDYFIGAQVIGLFDDATDRTTQLPTPVADGQRAYLRDTGVEYVAVKTSVDPDPVVFEWVEFGRTKGWDTSHVPTLTATGTSPTIGTGPVLECRWTKEGTLATVAFFVKFGSSGSAAGTGIYELDLPPELPAAPAWYGAEEYVAGNGVAVDSSTSTTRTVAVKIVGASTIRLEADGLTGPVTESNLIAWGDADVVLSGTITYETEEV